MSQFGVPAFDKSIDDGHIWLNALMLRLGTSNSIDAYHILRATIHALRDRIGPENAVHLSAQLPLLIRGLFFEGWQPRDGASRERHIVDFLDHVASEIPNAADVDTEKAVRAVFEVMWERIDQGEVAKLMRILPPEIRSLWQRRNFATSAP